MKLRNKNGLYTLVSAETQNVFFELRNDILSLALAQYLCDLTGQSVADGLESPRLMSLLLNSLYYLCRYPERTAFVKSVFETRLMAMTGYRPELSACMICGKEKSDMLFAFSMGGTVCSSCFSPDEHGHAYPLNDAVMNAMRYLAGADDKKIFSFRMDAASEKLFSAASQEFLLVQTGVSLKTLDFYNSLLHSEEK